MFAVGLLQGKLDQLQNKNFSSLSVCFIFSLWSLNKITGLVIQIH